MKITDVTNLVDYQANDGEDLPLTKCICGNEYDAWDFVLGIEENAPMICKKCGAKLYFSFEICVYKIED